jgi:hypothetical protein
MLPSYSSICLASLTSKDDIGQRHYVLIHRDEMKQIMAAVSKLFSGMVTIDS